MVKQMENISKQPTIRISAARKKLLADYADAAGCLYGVLSVSEFVDVFNHYEDIKSTFITPGPVKLPCTTPQACLYNLSKFSAAWSCRPFL